MGGLPTQSAKPALGLIAFIVFIDMAGIGLIVPVMPRLVMRLSGEGVDRAAEIGGWLLFAYAVMQFVFSPVIGGLSDRFGRRPVLLITLAALGIDYALMSWAPTLAWLFAGRMISGIMGATWAAANSCVADTIEPDKRGAVYGLLGGAGAAGFVLGPALGRAFGLLGDRVPFIVASVLCLAGAAYGYYALAETLPPEKRRAFSCLNTILTASFVEPKITIRCPPLSFKISVNKGIFKRSCTIYTCCDTPSAGLESAMVIISGLRSMVFANFSTEGGMVAENIRL